MCVCKYVFLKFKVKLILPMKRRHERTAKQLQWTDNPMLNRKLGDNIKNERVLSELYNISKCTVMFTEKHWTNKVHSANY